MMRTIFGLFSLLSFVGGLFIALLLVSNPPAQPLYAALALALLFGLTVFFRALRSRVT